MGAAMDFDAVREIDTPVQPGEWAGEEPAPMALRARTPDAFLNRGRWVLRTEAEEIARLAGRLDGRFGEAIELLLDCMAGGGKVVILGVGKSGNIAHKISATLNSTGCPSLVLNSQDALHGDIGVLAENDVVIVLSNSGETEELLNVLPVIRSFGAKMIALTGRMESTLARVSTVALDTSVTREACPLGLAPTSSTTVALALGDALAMTLLDARGFRREDFARFHPGGSLGRALLHRVCEIMRPVAEIAVCREDSPISEALSLMALRKTGAAVVTGPAGQLRGVFTHGDFVRFYLQDPSIGARPIAQYMTPDPITVREQALAADVVAILREHHIDDLIVVSEEHRPVGLVDSQDFARLRLI
jgi:arabinose-5-phosphate isomerase